MSAEQDVPLSGSYPSPVRCATAWMPATGFDRTLILWRSETVAATFRFLDALLP